MNRETKADWDSSTQETRDTRCDLADLAKDVGRDAVERGDVDTVVASADLSASLSGGTGDGY